MRVISIAVVMMWLGSGCGGNVGTADMGGGGGQPGVGGNGNGGTGDMTTVAHSRSPVSLKNASMRALDMASYNLTFVVSDDVFNQSTMSSILRVDELHLQWDQEPEDQVGINCETQPWTLALPTTSAITIGMVPDDYAIYHYTVPCDDGMHTQPVEGNDEQAKAPSGTVHLTLVGVLEDATPFTAEADAPVLQ